MPFFAAACDYALIGEELLTAGAYISKDAARLGSVHGQDLAKLIAFGVMLLGAIFCTLNINVVVDLLSK